MKRKHTEAFDAESLNSAKRQRIESRSQETIHIDEKMKKTSGKIFGAHYSALERESLSQQIKS